MSEVPRTNMRTVGEIAEALLAPFSPSEVKWKPQTLRGDHALALCYVDARCVMDRLDSVLGIDGWSDAYERLESGSVMCKLTCSIGGKSITHEDVGSESKQPNEGDRNKAAVSDAFKRAAVKFGVGRYLYRLGMQWVPYDVQKKCFVKEPTLPAWAIPVGLPPRQAAELEKLTKAAAADMPKLLAHYGITRLSDLPESDYAQCRALLLQRMKRNAEAAAQAVTDRTAAPKGNPDADEP